MMADLSPNLPELKPGDVQSDPHSGNQRDDSHANQSLLATIT